LRAKVKPSARIGFQQMAFGTGDLRLTMAEDTTGAVISETPVLLISVIQLQ